MSEKASQAPSEMRLVDTIRSGGEEGAKLALADIEKEQERESVASKILKSF